MTTASQSSTSTFSLVVDAVNDSYSMEKLLLDIESVHVYSNINNYLNLVCLPIIIFVGLVGNTLSVLVFLCTHLNSQSSSIYLASLNIADIASLICIIPSTLVNIIGVDVLDNIGGCRFVVYITYVSTFISVWTVVCFTTELCVINFYSHKKNELCTPKTAWVIIMCLNLLAFTIYILAPVMSDVTVIDQLENEKICGPKSDLQLFWMVFWHIDCALTIILPSCLILILNTLIVLKMYNPLCCKQNVGKNITI